jgi:hypothetical protein
MIKISKSENTHTVGLMTGIYASEIYLVVFFFSCELGINKLFRNIAQFKNRFTV